MDGNGRWAKQRRRPRSFGHPCRPEGRPPGRGVLSGARHPIAHPVRVLQRKLAAAAHRGACIDWNCSCVHWSAKSTNCTRMAYVSASSAISDAFELALHEGMLKAMQRTQGNNALEHERGGELRWPLGHRPGQPGGCKGRGARGRGGRGHRRGMARPTHVPGRPAPARPLHPHRRRASREQLPALAAGVCGTSTSPIPSGQTSTRPC